MSGTVVVAGSANLDLFYRVERIPAPGETVLATGSSQAPGGKGQNQVIAAARAGARTVFLGAVGRDAAGTSLIETMNRDLVDTSLIRVVSEPTGTAIIALDDAAENSIIVNSGANAQFSALTDQELSAIRSASVLALQLEIPLETVAAAAAAAHAEGATVILNAAPIRELPDALIANVDILIVNEHELAHLAGRSGDRERSLDDAVVQIAATVPTLIVTLGAEGVLVAQRDADDTLGLTRIPAYVVAALDTTGAGDTFCGAFAAHLSDGFDVDSAARFATAAASLAVEQLGAVPAIPFRKDIDARVSR